MTRITKHYDPPVPFEKYVPAVSRTSKPNPTKETTMVDYSNDISRGPYHSMLDKMARARQAITGESYAKAFTETYCDPKNISIKDGAQYDHLAKAMDSTYGTRLSPIPAQKAAPYDPLAKASELAEHLGPAHARLHSMAVEHARTHPELTYAQAYTRLYLAPENVALRAGIAAEDGVRTLTLEEARALTPTKPFPAYTSPGHDERDVANVGRSGAKPRGYIGG
jgi:hypothetical protein